jgi:hypothetical protein
LDPSFPGRETGHAAGDPRLFNMLRIGIRLNKDARFCVDVAGKGSNPAAPDEYSFPPEQNHG